MTTGAGLFLLFLLVGVGGAALLYLLVRTEHDRPVMDRARAERAARKDRDDEKEASTRATRNDRDEP